MSWELLSPLVGVVIGAGMAWLIQRDLAARQLVISSTLAQGNRLADFRRAFVTQLNDAVSDLIALALQEVPERRRDRDGAARR
jgi:hypothetical protein